MEGNLQDGVYETSSQAFPTSGPARGIRKKMEGNLQDGVYETSSPDFPTSGPARGIRKKMEGNLQDGVWLSPVQPSPLVDLQVVSRRRWSAIFRMECSK